MENFTPISAVLGGILIGIASFALLLFNGRIAGISGILENGLFLWQKSVNKIWSFWFLVGLIVGGEIIYLSGIPAFGTGHPHSSYLVLVGGLLVGFGARLGSGCTSGHGVCGLGRLSFRSFSSVITFMLTAFLVIYIKGLYL